MGGLALKNTFTRRYERAEFDVISVELLDTLKKTFKSVAMPLFYKNKQSFGDADIIVSMDGFTGNVRDYINETFKPNEIFHNGNCYSFDYKELQVDVITLAEEHFESNYNYLSYNDLGNYIGKIAHGFGMKYGQEGLMYDHYFKDENIGRIIISKDYDKIYSFLGLSYDRWKEGFNELEDIFKFISESPYFNWEYLQLENNNRVNRERDVKRKSYMSFLDYIEANVKDDNHKFDYGKDKTVYLNLAIKKFPAANIQFKIRELEYIHCKKLYITAKFNGGEVMRRYGLEGSAIGYAMTGFKTWLVDRILKITGNNQTFEELILKSTEDMIYTTFENYLAEIKNEDRRRTKG